MKGLNKNTTAANKMQLNTKHMTVHGSTRVIAPYNFSSIHEIKYSKMDKVKFVKHSL